MKNRNKINLTSVLAVIYGILLIWLVLFKLSTVSQIADLYRARSVNFIPFYYDNETSSHLSEVVWNIVIFLPAGLYLRMLNVKPLNTVLFAACFSLALEISQFTFSIGGADITDLITNTAGAAAGVGIYGLLSLTFKNKAKLDKIISIIALSCTVFLVGFIVLILFLNA